nr:HEAT repeat domain-containing protein [Acidobacteriota bacterium]
MSHVQKASGPAVVLSESMEKLLRADFKPLSKLQVDLPDRLMSYLLTGEPATIIDELSSVKGGGNALQLTMAYHQRRGKFFRTVEVRDPQFFLRLALIYSRLAQTDFPGEFIYARLGETDYLDCFLYQLVEGAPYLAPTVRENPKLEAELVAQLCVLAGHQPDYIARLAFLANPDSPQTNISEMCQALAGFADYCTHHPEPIREALSAGNQAQSILALKILDTHHIKISDLLPEIIGLVFKSGKKVRELAVAVLQTAKSEAEAWLKTHFAGQKAADQMQSLKLLVDLAGTQAHPTLLTWKKQTTEDKVLVQIDEYVKVFQPVPGVQLPTLVPLLPVETNVPLSPELEQLLIEILPYTSKEVKHPKPEAISEALAKGTVGILEKTSLWPGEWEKFSAVLKKFVTHPQAQLIHVIRLLVMTDNISARYRDTEELFYPESLGAVLLDLYRQSHSPAFDLRQLAAVVKAVGVNSDRVGGTIIHADGGWNRYDIFRYEPEAVWPYFAENLHLLEDVFNPKKILSGYGVEHDQACRRRNALQVLQIFPMPPQSLLPVLWETALGTSKLERPLAQQCLESQPRTLEKLLAALEDKNLATRQAAAEWLGRLNHPEAIEPLKSLLRKEKSEAGRGVLLTALEKLGASVDEFLNRDGLMAEANDGLKKGIPDALSWFPFDQLPALHWSDTGELIDPKIVTWWLVQANKQGTPEPGPILRRYAGLIELAERHSLGQLILEAWIAQDTVPAYTPDQIEQELQKFTQQLSQSSWVAGRIDQ